MFVKTVSRKTVSFENPRLPLLGSKSKSFRQEVSEITAIMNKNIKVLRIGLNFGKNSKNLICQTG